MQSREYYETIADQLCSTDASHAEKAMELLLSITDPTDVLSILRLSVGKSETGEVLHSYLQNCQRAVHDIALKVILWIMQDKADAFSMEVIHALKKFPEYQQIPLVSHVLKYQTNPVVLIPILRYVSSIPLSVLCPLIVTIAVTHSDQSLRITAIKSIRIMNYFQGITELSQLLKQKNLSVEIIESLLVTCGSLCVFNPISWRFFVPWCFDTNEKIRLSAIFGLSKIKNKNVLLLLTRLLKSEHVLSIKMALLQAIALYKNKKSLSVLLDLIDKSSEKQIIRLAESLVDSIPAHVRRMLLRKKINHKNERIMICCIHHLGEIRKKDDSALLLVKFRKALNPLIKAAAAEALGKFNDYAIIQQLLGEIDTDPLVCYSVIMSISEARFDTKLSVLEKLLHHHGKNKELVIQSVLTILPKIVKEYPATAELKQSLVTILDSNNLTIKHLAIQALASTGDKKLAPYFLEQLHVLESTSDNKQNHESTTAFLRSIIINSIHLLIGNDYKYLFYLTSDKKSLFPPVISYINEVNAPLDDKYEMLCSFMLLCRKKERMEDFYAYIVKNLITSQNTVLYLRLLFEHSFTDEEKIRLLAHLCNANQYVLDEVASRSTLYHYIRSSPAIRNYLSQILGYTQGIMDDVFDIFKQENDYTLRNKLKQSLLQMLQVQP